MKSENSDMLHWNVLKRLRKNLKTNKLSGNNVIIIEMTIGHVQVVSYYMDITVHHL